MSIAWWWYRWRGRSGRHHRCFTTAVHQFTQEEFFIRAAVVAVTTEAETRQAVQLGLALAVAEEALIQRAAPPQLLLAAYWRRGRAENIARVAAIFGRRRRRRGDPGGRR